MSDTVSKADVIPFKKRSTFLEKPMPERIQSVYMLDGEMRTLSILSIGVTLRTQDNRGLKIVPQKEVMFAIGDNIDPERTTFSVDASSAKAIRDRLDEFIAACEAPITSRETTAVILNGESE